MTSSPLDELDVRLVGAMAAQPRVGVLELSRQLRVARATVQSRLDRLVRLGVLTGFGPELDLPALGFDVLAFATLEIAQGRLAAVTEHLRGIPQVLDAHGTTGVGDVHCRVVARSHEELQQVLLAITSTPDVVRSSSVVALSELVATRTRQLLDL